MNQDFRTIMINQLITSMKILQQTGQIGRKCIGKGNVTH